MSQQTLARRIGWPQSRYSKFERNIDPITVADVCTVATMLGLKPRFELYRVDEGLRDAGHSRLISRLQAALSAAWSVALEAPFPTLGDLRSWDALLRLGTSYRVGVEAETRLRDVQELVRRIRQRELHGGVDAILIVLSDSAHNRRSIPELRAALGPDYTAMPPELMSALRGGLPLPGSAVVLL